MQREKNGNANFFEVINYLIKKLNKNYCCTNFASIFMN